MAKTAEELKQELIDAGYETKEVGGVVKLRAPDEPEKDKKWLAYRRALAAGRRPAHVS